MADSPRRRGAGPAIVAGALVAVAVLVGIVLVAGGDDGGTGGGTTGAAGTPEQALTGDTSSLTGDCADVHAGHAGMMWSPSLADEMVDAGCGWPYEPFVVPLDGGTDDPDLDAPFEAHRYEELWSMLSGAGMGLCSVGADTTDAGGGRAFEFTYTVAGPGCPGAEPTGTMVVAEYGTEAQRDAAALAEDAGEGVPTYVLGRWVLHLDGSAAALGAPLSELGAQAA